MEEGERERERDGERDGGEGEGSQVKAKEREKKGERRRKKKREVVLPEKLREEKKVDTAEEEGGVGVSDMPASANIVIVQSIVRAFLARRKVKKRYLLHLQRTKVCV